MFSENLSTALLAICDAYELSYEAAAECCHISARYFGDIVRCKSTPTIKVLNKICTAFKLTPDELLLYGTTTEPPDFLNKPKSVTEIRKIKNFNGSIAFPVCPQCGITLEREFQAFCDRCGQRLDWNTFCDKN